MEARACLRASPVSYIRHAFSHSFHFSTCPTMSTQTRFQRHGRRPACGYAGCMQPECVSNHRFNVHSHSKFCSWPGCGKHCASKAVVDDDTVWPIPDHVVTIWQHRNSGMPGRMAVGLCDAHYTLFVKCAGTEGTCRTNGHRH